MGNQNEKSQSPNSFSYFDRWRNCKLFCVCGWSGPLDPDQTEPHRILLEFSCPSCDTALAFVHYPTDEEMVANSKQLSSEERTNLAKRQAFLSEVEGLALHASHQLPDLEGASLDLSWDFVTEGRNHYTIIRHHNQVVWKERAFWEGIERFNTVLGLLKTKYGDRLIDLIPTESSLLYLYGDNLSAPEEVRRIRRSLAR